MTSPHYGRDTRRKDSPMPIYYRGLPPAPQNPILRALAVIAGLGMFVLMLFLGVMFLAVFLALGAVAWAALAVRRWWLTRGGAEQSGDSDIIDVEYRVVERRERRR